MAVAIESSASTSETSTASLTITKPTGLAEGDHLVGLIFERSGGTPQTPSGWTSKDTPYCEPNFSLACRLVTKLADGTDVAASNFSFPSSDDASQLMRGLLLRVSGLSSDLQLDSSYERVVNDSTPSFTSLTTTPYGTGALTLAVFTNNYVATFTDATVSPDDATFTEYLDNDAVTIYGAVRSASSQITGLDPTGSLSTSLADTVGYVATVAAAVDDSDSNNLLTTTTTVFTQDGSTDATGGNTLLSTTVTVNSQSGVATAPDSWTTANKPSTIWTTTNK